MEAVLGSLTSGLPILVLHFTVTIIMLAVGVAVYAWMTPQKELELIREGNVAAAVSLSGAVLSMALPLAFCMAASINVFDIVVWGLVTLVIMLVAYRVADLILKGLTERITQGEVAPAIFLSAIKLAVAAVTAAAVSG